MSPSQHAFDTKLTAFASRTHAALLQEARRPVESISEEHVNRLREQMVEQNRFTWPDNMSFNV